MAWWNGVFSTAEVDTLVYLRGTDGATYVKLFASGVEVFLQHYPIVCDLLLALAGACFCHFGASAEFMQATELDPMQCSHPAASVHFLESYAELCKLKGGTTAPPLAAGLGQSKSRTFPSPFLPAANTITLFTYVCKLYVQLQCEMV